MKLKPFLCVSLILLVAGCAVPDFDAMTKSRQAPVKAPESGPYSQGPVVLLLDGKDGANCKFNLQALYPLDIEPHSIEMQIVYSDLVSGATADIFGGIQQLPLVDVPWTTMTSEGVMTKVTNWDADGPCAQSRLYIEVKKCWQGNCPRYVAGESRIPMQLVLAPY
jgi:hypothetical protein